MAMTEHEKERRIEEMMRVANMSRKQAEFAVAIESGEISGDTIDVSSGQTDEKKRQQ